MKVHGVLNVRIVDDAELMAKHNTDKPFLWLTTPDGESIKITLNVGEMVGGAAKGARLRWEDMRQ